MAKQTYMMPDGYPRTFGFTLHPACAILKIDDEKDALYELVGELEAEKANLEEQLHNRDSLLAEQEERILALEAELHGV